jgi:hypothetical protein
MALSDVLGVFSRYFIVGFFLPAFFAVAVLSQVLDRRVFPASYEQAGSATQVLVLAGAGLLVALLSSGLHFPILRLYEGYPLQHGRRVPGIGWIYTRMVRPAHRLGVRPVAAHLRAVSVSSASCTRFALDSRESARFSRPPACTPLHPCLA